MRQERSIAGMMNETLRRNQEELLRAQQAMRNAPGLTREQREVNERILRSELQRMEEQRTGLGFAPPPLVPVGPHMQPTPYGQPVPCGPSIPYGPPMPYGAQMPYGQPPGVFGQPPPMFYGQPPRHGQPPPRPMAPPQRMVDGVPISQMLDPALPPEERERQEQYLSRMMNEHLQRNRDELLRVQQAMRNNPGLTREQREGNEQILRSELQRIERQQADLGFPPQPAPMAPSRPPGVFGQPPAYYGQPPPYGQPAQVMQPSRTQQSHAEVKEGVFSDNSCNNNNNNNNENV